MQLHLGARREIIEDILDITIFTSMNKVLKEKITSLENQIRVLDDDTLRSAMQLTFEEYSRRQAERAEKLYKKVKKDK